MTIPESGIQLSGTLRLPDDPAGLVIFAHGSGSSRFSPRNRAVAAHLNMAGVATLLFDLLTEGEAGDRAAYSTSTCSRAGSLPPAGGPPRLPEIDDLPVGLLRRLDRCRRGAPRGGRCAGRYRRGRFPRGPPRPCRRGSSAGQGSDPADRRRRGPGGARAQPKGGEPARRTPPVRRCCRRRPSLRRARCTRAAARLAVDWFSDRFAEAPSSRSSLAAGPGRGAADDPHGDHGR